MNSSQKLPIILIFPLIILFSSPTLSQPDFEAYTCVDDNGNYTTNSTFQTNLQRLLSSVASNTRINYGFYNISTGQNMDKVHGVGLCRGDVPTSDCKACISNATTKITSVCPNQKTAVGWYENCMIWYSNLNIFKGVAFRPRYNMTSPDDAPNPKRFNQTASTLLLRLANRAASGDSRLKFATGEANVTNNYTVHGLVQCIPDLQNFDCFNCLRILVNFTLAGCCYGSEGVRVGNPSCNIRLENYRFYKSAIVLPPLLPPAQPPFVPPSASTITKTGNRNEGTKIATIVVSTTVSSVALLAIFLGCFLRNQKKPVLEKIEGEEEDEIGIVESLQLNFSVVKAATNNFSDSNKLGQGGFGTVYKGRLSETGQEIAVKRLSKNSGQGEEQFKNEALLVAKLQHRNLVRFLGFSLEKDERLLIYEFMPNNSLDYFLFDPTKRVHLDWQKRYKIIGGIARGLLYLHEESRLLVVHRDLKASNVLLDAEMNPKISDFGMARLFGADQSHGNTSKIAGTYGYMPPEYLAHGHFSIKLDVFSFGVLVLEIVSGQKVSNFSQAEKGESLLSFAWRNWLEGNALNLVDSTMSAVNTAEVLRCINIGLLCVQENAAQRPIMSSVVLMLNSYSVSLSVPLRPAFFVLNAVDADDPFMERNGRPLDGSVNEASLSSLEPR